MIESNRLMYRAIITLSLPDSNQRATVHVSLGPEEQLPAASGQALRLGDCTLGDLRAYAQELESEVWADYQHIRLVDLGDQAVTVELALPPEAGGAAAQALLGLVLLPADQVEPGQEEEAAEEAQPGPAAPAPGAEPEAATDEPAITVAESEPVHEERQAAAEPVPEPAREGAISPRLRILGRRRPLGHPTWTAVDILMNEPAFRDAQAHALSSMNREVAGILVGPQPEKQPDGRYLVHISDVIIARHTRMHGASVTYTPESWRYVNDVLAARYPQEEAVIVGWYHTHPAFGVFLSGMDQFIHQNFFTQIWHVALVLDPVAARSGFFCWDRSQSRVEPYPFPWPEWASSAW